MRHWSTRSVACGIARTAPLVLAALLSAGTAGARGQARASITAVSFSGGPAKPIVTVTGHALSIPAPNPNGSPSNQPLCPKKINGNAGLDYGTAFYFTAFQDDTHVYSGGRYRPAKNELDCIGLIVLAHSATKVKFTFGAAYAQPDFGYPRLTNGSLVEVVLRGAAFGIVVRYR